MEKHYSDKLYLNALAGGVILGLVFSTFVGIKVLIGILLAAVRLDAHFAIVFAPLGWVPLHVS